MLKAYLLISFQVSVLQDAVELGEAAVQAPVVVQAVAEVVVQALGLISEAAVVALVEEQAEAAVVQALGQGLVTEAALHPSRLYRKIQPGTVSSYHSYTVIHAV
jgi:hypothetical protein